MFVSGQEGKKYLDSHLDVDDSHDWVGLGDILNALSEMLAAAKTSNRNLSGRYYTGWFFFNLPSLKVPDYIAHSIKQVLSVRIYLPAKFKH